MTRHTRKHRVPRGCLSIPDCVALIADRCDKHLDADQLRAVASRRGIRRQAALVEFYDDAGRLRRTVPTWCYVEADLRKHLRWIKQADDRMLDIVSADELPTVAEIYRRARIERDLRDLLSGRLQDVDKDEDGWTVPEIRGIVIEE